MVARAIDVIIKTAIVGYFCLSIYEMIQAHNNELDMKIDRVSSGNSKILDTSINEVPTIEITRS